MFELLVQNIAMVLRIIYCDSDPGYVQIVMNNFIGENM